MARRRGSGPRRGGSGGQGPRGEGGVRKAFAMVPPGLEPVLAAELEALGVDGVRAVEGGALFPGTTQNLSRTLQGSRVAARVLYRLGRVRAASMDELYQGARKLPWSEVIGHPRQPVKVEISSRGSRLRRGSAVQKKLELAIRDALRGPRLAGGRPERSPVVVHLRIVDDRATVGVDAGGDPIHQHGWRRQTAKAPLRENLAAAMLWAAGWQPGIPLVDPMCGAGTLPILGARWAAGMPPRLDRRYACEAWPRHDARAWRAATPRAAKTPTAILASDRDPGAVRATKANADRAGVGGRLTLRHTPFHELTPPDGDRGLLLANLPYGRRVGEDADLVRFYEQVGSVLTSRWRGWRAAFLVADPRLLPRLHPGLEVSVTFKNGGIPVALGVAERL